MGQALTAPAALTDPETAQARERTAGLYHGWWIVAVCFWAGVCAWGTVFYGHAFYMPSLSRLHGWSYGLISSAITVSWLVGIAAMLAVGSAIDRHGARRPMILGALAVGGGAMLLGVIDAPWQLFLVYCLMQSGFPAIATPAISGALSPWFERRYGFALSLAMTGSSVGGAAFTPALIWLAGLHGFRDAVFAAGLLTAVSVPVLALLLLRRPATAGDLRKTPHGPAAPFDRMAILRQPAFWTITIGCGLALCGQVGFLAHQVAFLSGYMSAQLAGFGVTVALVAAIIGRLVIGALTARFPVRRLCAACYLVMMAGLLTLAASETLPMLWLGCAIAGAVTGGLVMLPPILVRQTFGAPAFGRIMAMTNIGLFAAMGLGPGIVGLLHDLAGDYSLALPVLAALQVAAVAVVLLPGRRD